MNKFIEMDYKEGWMFLDDKRCWQGKVTLEKGSHNENEQKNKLDKEAFYVKQKPFNQKEKRFYLEHAYNKGVLSLKEIETPDTLPEGSIYDYVIYIDGYTVFDFEEYGSYDYEKETKLIDELVVYLAKSKRYKDVYNILHEIEIKKQS